MNSSTFYRKWLVEAQEKRKMCTIKYVSVIGNEKKLEREKKYQNHVTKHMTSSSYEDGFLIGNAQIERNLWVRT